ncbi:hypothetical protein Slala03_10890 [Streptomyces lavendulae subsp. lavendulae]|nr:hypothetical protein Slala03_10890 [Streptomyces lavendulae subsp. lavendulae]
MSTFSDTPGTSRRSSPKRRRGERSNSHRTETFHFPSITDIAAAIPQWSAPGLRATVIAHPSHLLAHPGVTTHPEVRT